MKQEAARFGNPAFWINKKMLTWGFLGPDMVKMDKFAQHMFREVLPGYDSNKVCWTWQGQCEYMETVRILSILYYTIYSGNILSVKFGNWSQTLTDKNFCHKNQNCGQK